MTSDATEARLEELLFSETVDASETVDDDTADSEGNCLPDLVRRVPFFPYHHNDQL
jgi:hypothetical protein